MTDVSVITNVTQWKPETIGHHPMWASTDYSYSVPMYQIRNNWTVDFRSRTHFGQNINKNDCTILNICENWWQHLKLPIYVTISSATCLPKTGWFVTSHVSSVKLFTYTKCTPAVWELILLVWHSSQMFFNNVRKRMTRPSKPRGCKDVNVTCFIICSP